MRTSILSMLEAHLTEHKFYFVGKRRKLDLKELQGFDDKKLVQVFIDTMRHYDSYAYNDVLYLKGQIVEKDDVRTLVSKIIYEMYCDGCVLFDRDIDDEAYLDHRFFNDDDDADILKVLTHNLFDHKLYARTKKLIKEILS